MLATPRVVLLAAALWGQVPVAGSPGPAEPAAPTRLFPSDYATRFQVLRTFVRPRKPKLGTVYANDLAASVTTLEQLPYASGSLFAVEYREELLTPEGQPVLDADGRPRPGRVGLLDVMRRDLGFGEVYGAQRTGDWAFARYLPDGTEVLAPAKAVVCAACHTGAGAQRDFVFRGRFPKAGSD